ncbi:hypothetical protein GJAV_G00170120 [Gymnothorax javanicus]|nr:hypothetical protein GJAV_G00170120 [Gymnothorax javanicus]
MGAKLGIGLKKHCAYHSQSAGLVERTNGTLKAKLAKAMYSTNLTWVEALPLALYSMRQQPAKDTFLSPHELLTGRPMPGPPGDPNVVPTAAVLQTDLSDYMRALGNMTKLLSPGASSKFHKRRGQRHPGPRGDHWRLGLVKGTRPSTLGRTDLDGTIQDH